MSSVLAKVVALGLLMVGCGPDWDKLEGPPNPDAGAAGKGGGGNPGTREGLSVPAGGDLLQNPAGANLGGAPSRALPD